MFNKTKPPTLADHVATLMDANQKLLVRRLVDREDELGDAFIEVFMEETWVPDTTPEEWEETLHEARHSGLTLGEWLKEKK